VIVCKTLIVENNVTFRQMLGKGGWRIDLSSFNFSKLYKKEDLLMKKIHFVLAVMVLIAFSTPALAQIRPGALSLSPFVGGYLFEGNQDLNTHFQDLLACFQ